MMRLVVLVGCLATATAAAQGSPVTSPAPGAAGVSTEPTPAPAPAAPGEAGGGDSWQTTEATAPDTTTITTTAEPSEGEPLGPTPEPPPGGLYGLPPAPRAGPNLIAAPEEALKPRPEVEDDPLFLPSVLLIGGGSAVLLASLFTGLGAHSSYQQLERDCSDDICPAGWQQKIDDGRTLAIVSTILTGVGIVAAGTGTALLVVAATRVNEDRPERAQSRLRLTSGPTGLGLGASASF